jgi:hypothetical protein
MPIDPKKFFEGIIEGIVGFIYASLATLLGILVRPIAEPRRLATEKVLSNNRVSARALLFISALIFASILTRFSSFDLDYKTISKSWPHSLIVAIGLYILLDIMSVAFGKLLIRSYFEKQSGVDRLRYAFGTSWCLISLAAFFPSDNSHYADGHSFDWTLVRSFIIPMYPLAFTLLAMTRARLANSNLVVHGLAFIAVPISILSIEALTLLSLDKTNVLVSGFLGEPSYDLSGIGLLGTHSCLLYDDNTVVATARFSNHTNNDRIIGEDEFQAHLSDNHWADDANAKGVGVVILGHLPQRTATVQSLPTGKDGRYGAVLLKANTETLMSIQFKIDPNKLPAWSDNADCVLDWKDNENPARMRKVNGTSNPPAQR